MGANIMLALGAIVMFGTFLGSSNRVMMGNTQIASQNEYYIAALSYAQSVIDEAKTKAFSDEYAPVLKTVEGKMGVSVVVIPAGEVKEVYHIGTESADENVSSYDALREGRFASESHFNDVDDYNGYSRLVNSPRAEGYHIHISVAYVHDEDPNEVKHELTNSKKMFVSVTSPYFPKDERSGTAVQDTLKLSYVFTR